MRKATSDQNEKFNREIKTMKEKKSVETLEQKNTMNELKTSIENISSRIDQAESRICELEDRLF